MPLIIIIIIIIIIITTLNSLETKRDITVVNALKSRPGNE